VGSGGDQDIAGGGDQEIGGNDDLKDERLNSGGPS